MCRATVHPVAAPSFGPMGKAPVFRAGDGGFESLPPQLFVSRRLAVQTLKSRDPDNAADLYPKRTQGVPYGAPRDAIRTMWPILSMTGRSTSDVT